MLKGLLAVQKSRTTVWQQTILGESNVQLESSVYKIASIRKESSNVSTMAQIVTSRSRASDPPRAIICFSDAEDQYDFAEGACVQIFPPWAQIPGPEGLPLIFCRLFRIEEHSLSTQLPASSRKPSSLFLNLRQFGTVFFPFVQVCFFFFFTS